MEFHCTNCGGCCHVTNLSQYNIEQWGLTTGEDGYCSNFKDGACSIYEDRPLICRVEDAFDRFEELKEVEPQLYNFLKRMHRVLSRTADMKLEYFKAANMGCNFLIRRLELDKAYLIDLRTVYKEVDTKPEMPNKDKLDKEQKREERAKKRRERWNYRVERIKALTQKALAVAKKRKWLVFLIGIGLAAYFAITSGGGFSGVLDTIKGLLGR